MIIEIRTYRLQPGTTDEFVRVMHEEAIPLMKKWGLHVVRCGPSLVAEEGHEEACLIRAFPSIEAHREQEDAFYGSDAWRLGPQPAVLAPIESYHSIVLEASDDAALALAQS